MNVTGSVSSGLNWTIKKTAGLLAAGLSIPITPSSQAAYTNGTGDNQVDLLYAAKLTLAAAPLTLDLTALTEPYTGATLNFARVREVYYKNNNAVAGQDVTITAGTNPWTGFVTEPSKLEAAGSVRGSAPIGTGFVVSGTSKTITFDPGANTITIDVNLAGCSA